MNRLETVVLANNHTIAECWNPYLHKSPFNAQGADTVELWYMRQGFGDGKILRVSPVCIFGGTKYSPHVFSEHASKTYAACSSCRNTMMCGWADGVAHPQPESCEKCGASLGLNDYFQVILRGGGGIKKEDVIDPLRDPAVTITEACALSAKGIPFHVLPAIVAILTNEKLLRFGSFIDDIEVT